MAIIQFASNRRVYGELLIFTSKPDINGLYKLRDRAKQITYVSTLDAAYDLLKTGHGYEIETNQK